MSIVNVPSGAEKVCAGYEAGEVHEGYEIMELAVFDRFALSGNNSSAKWRTERTGFLSFHFNFLHSDGVVLP